ncbi:hypothetical protein M427DRAFT_64308 [Gonapodya prolifera JEL478]|uniref:Uncharacterized protein n=1 Tax=Gonapodya prolifera (strain JEL478) TaxID=1344416 RepID=A0A138ZXW3_GONPJ|nr:hypothetical protein M427DRAFT_64308 [Gonapodya prolifera JEL478]|eukprot:KXS09344.1 hypothetical protein M427DRAFT_64308 [Gonapodya prolifera JEL478]
MPPLPLSIPLHLNRSLIEAIEAGSLSRVRDSLAAGASARAHKLVASSKGPMAVMKGEKGDYEREDGESALLLAIVYGSAEIVKLLIEHGADPNASCRFTNIITTSAGAVRFATQPGLGGLTAVQLAGKGPLFTLSRGGFSNALEAALHDGRYSGLNEKGGWVLDMAAVDRKIDTKVEVLMALLEGGAVVTEEHLHRAAEVAKGKSGAIFGKKPRPEIYDLIMGHYARQMEAMRGPPAYTPSAVAGRDVMMQGALDHVAVPAYCASGSG